VLVGTLIPLVGVVAIYRWWPASRWPAAFLLLWFVLTLVPAFTVMFRVSASAPIADRYLYLPSVATSVLIAWGFTAATRRLRLPGVATALTAGVTLIALTAATWSYQTVWRDDYAFWSAAAAAAPEDGLAQRELGSTLLALGRLDEAERVLSRALQLPADPTSAAMTHSNLGLVYRRLGKFDDAVAAMKAAIAIAPHPALYHNLGLTWMAKAEADQKAGNRAAVGGDVRSARDALDAALAFETSAPQRGMLEQWSPAKTHALLAQVLTALGDRAGARAHLEASLRLQPSGPMADTVRRQLDALR
jgi:Flp pilus assembly protein TadD